MDAARFFLTTGNLSDPIAHRFLAAQQRLGRAQDDFCRTLPGAKNGNKTRVRAW
jgi:hypothetical protein